MSKLNIIPKVNPNKCRYAYITSTREEGAEGDSPPAYEIDASLYIGWLWLSSWEWNSLVGFLYLFTEMIEWIKQREFEVGVECRIDQPLKWIISWLRKQPKWGHLGQGIIYVAPSIYYQPYMHTHTLQPFNYPTQSIL